MDRFATTEKLTKFSASMSTEEFLAAFMKKAEEVKTEEAEAAEREITVDELRRLKSPTWTWTPPTF